MNLFRSMVQSIYKLIHLHISMEQQANVLQSVVEGQNSEEMQAKRLSK